MNFLSYNSDEDRGGDIVLLSLPHKGPAVDLAAISILHHLPPVELETRVHQLYQHCS